MDKRSVFLALNALKGMTPRLFWKIVQDVADPGRIFSMSEERLTGMGLTREMAGHILHERDPNRIADPEEHRVRDMGGKILVHGDPGYPPALMQIADPPPVLYFAGTILKEDRLAFAIVGSRAASTQGRLNAEKIAGKLAGLGLTIVSGLAMGIDTWAHQGALMAGGRTIALLGCGLDHTYPKYNRDLRERIAEHGALVSEFPMGTPPLPMNFPRRNRLISGISMGTLVVEAAIKSGSLITAKYALDQGRDVFAIPGNIRSPLSSGVNALIKKGAKLVQGVEDIIEEFPDEVRKYLKLNEKKVEERPEGQNREESRIMKLIHNEPVHIDELTRETSMAPAAISSLLMKLEMQGLVRQLPGKLFIRP
ncbi:MAG: DNA-processing protein DprA [bacterium]|mgnify:CR=1 FL=1